MIHCQILNITDLQRHFLAGDSIDSNALYNKSLIPRASHPYKILGNAPVAIPLNFRVRAISRSSIRQIEAAGGTVDLE